MSELPNRLAKLLDHKLLDGLKITKDSRTNRHFERSFTTMVGIFQARPVFQKNSNGTHVAFGGCNVVGICVGRAYTLTRPRSRHNTGRKSRNQFLLVGGWQQLLLLASSSVVMARLLAALFSS